jgi:hypothetical protein
MIERVSTSETSINVYETTQRNTEEAVIFQKIACYKDKPG